MSGGNPLVVAAPEGYGGPTANFGSFNEFTNGLKMIDSAADSAAAFKNGDWIEGSINAMAAGIDAVSVALNPLGGAISMVVNWILEHCGYVQQFLDELFGNAGVIQSVAQTWENVAQALDGLATELVDAVNHATSGMEGLTVSAYRGYGQAQATMIQGMAQVTSGVGGGVALAGGVLGGVRLFVESAFSDLVGQAIGAAATSAATLGIAAPSAFGGLIAKATSLVNRCRTLAQSVARSLDKFAELIGKISPAMESAAKVMAKAADHASHTSEIQMTFAVSMAKGTSTSDDPSPNTL